MTITLELAIARTAAGHAATLTAELPGGDSVLAAGVPVTLNGEALRALELIPDVYGAALTAMAFPAALREAWARGRGAAEGQAQPLRLRLALDPADDMLSALLWETLRDPIANLPLAKGEAVRLARYLPSASLIDLVPRPALHAVIAASAAGPPGAPPVDLAGLTDAACTGLADIPTKLLDGRAGHEPATLANLTAALRGAPLLCLICHGALVDGEPYLWLEQAGEGPYRPTSGAALAEALAQLERPPLLVVLAACQSGGTSYETLRAVGPQLAQAGVGAVLAMREQVPQTTVAALLPRLFAELRRDGQIDRALAAARAALGEGHPWWLPVLWMRARDGRLWREETPAPAQVPGGIHVGRNIDTFQQITITGGIVAGPIIGKQVNDGASPSPLATSARDPAAGLRERLELHRRTLSHYLQQLAITGSAHARPEVAHGIAEARGEIRRLKGALRGIGVAVTDHPDDEG